MFIISIWLAGMIVSIGAIIVELANFAYLIFKGAELNYIGFGVELLAFVLLALFCQMKYKKAKIEAEKSGPLKTEKQKQEEKMNGKKREKIVLCKPAMPWLVSSIVIYFFFIGAMIWTFVRFSWPILGVSAVLVVLSGYCVYKYMSIKQKIALEETKKDMLERKKAAKLAAIERQRKNQK